MIKDTDGDSFEEMRSLERELTFSAAGKFFREWDVALGGESSSITNQRMTVENYCRQNGITLVREFVNDGYSGGNFNRLAPDEMTAPVVERIFQRAAGDSSRDVSLGLNADCIIPPLIPANQVYQKSTAKSPNRL